MHRDVPAAGRARSVGAALALSLGLCLGPAAPALAGDIEAGKKLALTRGAGNCIACHAIAGGEAPGNMGPPLSNIQDRFPNRADLRSRLWDPTMTNPISAMPPFGKHGILTDKQLDDLVAFLYTL